MIQILTVLSLLLHSSAFAYFEISRTQRTEMNGIKYDAYKDFTKEWKLVTVRYREDTNELRMTYANDIAIKAMKGLKPQYPDGAKFGKVSYLLEEDPAFPSSKLPSESRRFQFMIRDKKLYKDTQGWGYALFDQNGHLYNEDVKEKTMACVACHQLVEERDFVFSRPIEYVQMGPLTRKNDLVVFKSKKPEELKGLNDYLKGSSASIESLEGTLKNHAFSGTLDEVVPLLTERSKAFSRSAILHVNEKNFTLVKLLQDQSLCKETPKKAFEIIIVFNGAKVRESKRCL